MPSWATGDLFGADVTVIDSVLITVSVPPPCEYITTTVIGIGWVTERSTRRVLTGET